MDIQLIDSNCEFQEANPELVFREFDEYHDLFCEYKCTYGILSGENAELQESPEIRFSILVNKPSISNGKITKYKPDNYNGVVRIGKEYQDFSRENEFQLTIPNASITVIRLILNTKSKIAPNLTNYEVFNRLQKIKSVCGELKTTMKIHGGNLDYVEEFLQLEDKTFEESLSLLVRNKLKVLSNSMAAKPKSDYEKALENMGYISRCLEENQSLHEKVKELNCKYESLKGTTNKFIDEIDRLNVLLAEERRSKNEPK